mgnify:FL=1
MRLTDWLHTFGVHSKVGDEYLITCPACKKPKLYFNIKKRVGDCKYVKCRFHVQSATISRLR